MTKQELLKTYPELVKEIAREVNNKIVIFSGINVDSAFDKYLKEQTKSDWEITAIQSTFYNGTHPEIIATLRPDGTFVKMGNTGGGGAVLETILQEKDIWIIYSICRNSDSEIFTVGDKILGGNGKVYTIEAIKLNTEYTWGLQLVTNIKNNYGIALKEVQKAVPLFKTVDGVNVYEPGDYYSIRGLFTLCREYVESKAKADYHIKEGYKYFSTKEAAEEYILLNKPLLSVQDFIDRSSNLPVSEKFIISIKMLAQQKLNSNGSNT